MKLKTLKDMNWGLKVKDSFDTGAEHGYYIAQIEVKKEAIKWVKELDLGIKNSGKNRSDVGWIKHFFNITKEHLK